MSKINHYDVLGVPRDCEQQLIDTVYKSMVRIFHPDVFKGDKFFAQEKLKVVNEAYSVVGDAERRKAYDAELRHSEGSGATEEIYEDERSDYQPFDDMYTEDWRVVISYFPKIDEMCRYLRKLNYSLSATFQILLISSKDYRRAESVFNKLKADFLKMKFGNNPIIHSIVLFSIESGNRNFALELNRDLLILGEYEYPIILERLGEKFKAFSYEYYPKSGIDDIKMFRESYGLKPGRYKTQDKSVFGISSDYTVYIEIPGLWGAKTYENVEKLILSGLVSSETVLTAEKIS